MSSQTRASGGGGGGGGGRHAAKKPTANAAGSGAGGMTGNGGGDTVAINNNNSSGNNNNNINNKKSDHAKADKEKIHSKVSLLCAMYNNMIIWKRTPNIECECLFCHQPTADQIRIAQITDVNNGPEDPKMREKVAELMEMTHRSEEDVCCALSECDNDLNRAGLFLLETLPVVSFMIFRRFWYIARNTIYIESFFIWLLFL